MARIAVAIHHPLAPGLDPRIFPVKIGTHLPMLLLRYEVCRFVRNADTLSRGQRMRLAPRGRSGTFLSCIDRGGEMVLLVC